MAEVDVLTARLDIAGLVEFTRGMAQADASVAALRKQLRGLTEDALAARGALAGLGVDTRAVGEVTALKDEIKRTRDTAVETAAATKTIGISDSAIAKESALNAELRKTRDLAVEVAAATRAISGGGGGTTNRAVLDMAEQSNAAQIRRIYNQGVRNQFLQSEAARRNAESAAAGLVQPLDARLVSDAAGRHNISQLLRLQAQRSAFGLIPGQDLRQATLAGQIPREDLRGMMNRLEGDSRRELAHGGLLGLLFGRGGAAGGGGGGGGSSGGGGGGFFTGLLPGGRRAAAGVVTAGIGLGLGALPAIAPAALGAAPLLGAGVGSLIGAAGTLKLAFEGITAAAFTNRNAFLALNPVQQQFVQTLRSLDAGLGKTLEGIAQRTLLPQLTSALHAAFTPAAVGSLSGGVGAFAGALGGGAQQFGHLFGSTSFQQQFGTMLQQDAGYLRTLLDVFTKLFDGFVRFQVAAGPFLTWVGQVTQHFANWVDQAMKADAANGRLAHFFTIVQTSLRTVGNLLASVGHLAGAFVDAIGFGNSVALVNLLAAAINALAGFLRENATVFSDFFGGAVKSGGDLLGVIRGIARALHPLLVLLDGIAKALGGWRVVIDTVATVWVARFLMMKLSILGIGTASKTASMQLALDFGEAGILGSITRATTAVGRFGLGLASLASRVGPLVGLYAVLTGIQNASQQKAGATNPYDTFSLSGLEHGFGLFQGKTWKNLTRDFFGSGHTAAQAGFSTEQMLAQAVASGLITPAQAFAASAGKQATFFNTTMAGGVAIPRTLSGSTPFNPAFATPGALQGTGQAGVLPIGLENAILAAQYSGNVSAQRSAVNAGIAWINTHIGSVKDAATRSQYLQEGITLKSQLASLASAQTSAAGHTYSQHIAAIGAGLSTRQAQISAARTALSGSTGGTPGEELRAVGAALRFAGTQMEQLDALKTQLASEKQTSRMKVEEARVQREINQTQSLINIAQKDQVAALRERTKAIKAEHEQQLANQIGRILGIGANEPHGAIAARRETGQLRSFLNTTLHQFGLAGTGSHPLGPFVQELYRLGDINKRQYTSLEKILAAIGLMKKDTGTISSGLTGNISERLKEIKQELTPQTGFTLTGAQHSLRAIIHASGAHLAGSPAQIARALEQGQYAQAHHGMVLSNRGAALGVPLTHRGAPSLSHVHITVEVKGDTPISRENARLIAIEAVAQARRKTMRNSVQMTGSNAGVNMGG